MGCSSNCRIYCRNCGVLRFHIILLPHCHVHNDRHFVQSSGKAHITLVGRWKWRGKALCFSLQGNAVRCSVSIATCLTQSVPTWWWEEIWGEVAARGDGAWETDGCHHAIGFSLVFAFYLSNNSTFPLLLCFFLSLSPFFHSISRATFLWCWPSLLFLSNVYLQPSWPFVSFQFPFPSLIQSDFIPLFVPTSSALPLVLLLFNPSSFPFFACHT